MAEPATVPQETAQPQEPEVRADPQAKFPLHPAPTPGGEVFTIAAPHLRRPFSEAAVKFKVQATFPREDPTGALIVPYIDARLVIERLNLILPGSWWATYEPTQSGMLWCHLTVDGITRLDVGEEVGNRKGLVSDALKRAAVHFGIGVSLYAMQRIRVYKRDGHLEEGGRDKLRLSPNGETHCRALYAGWLDTIGKVAFGEPLDHGDVGETVGDPDEHHGNGEAKPETQAKPAEAQEPKRDPEEGLAELLEKKSSLKEKRGEANQAMTALGAKPEQRLRELLSATSAKSLDALIARANAAADAQAEGGDS